MIERIEAPIAIGAVLLVLLGGCASRPDAPPPTVRNAAPPESPPELTPADQPPPEVEWTQAVDFGALREQYGRRRDFGARCEYPPERETALEAERDGDAERLLELTDSLLERCPVDPLFHHWRAAALEQAGLAREAEIHQRWVRGLFDSILASGDGKTMETPFVTISIAEEYHVLSWLGLTPRSQSLVGGPVMLDMIQAEREDGSRVDVYFNPSLHFLRLLEME